MKWQIGKFRWWYVWTIAAVAAVPSIITLLANYTGSNTIFNNVDAMQGLGRGILFSVVITLVLFAGNSTVLHYSAKKFPWESSKISSRLLTSFFGTVLFATVAMLAATWLWLRVFGTYYEGQLEKQVYFGNLLLGISLTIIVSSISEGRELFLKWKKQLLQAEQLKQEKLQAQLLFLKSQLNPHFLFNSLNSIFFLIKKKPEEAQETLMKLSEILSYSLYQSQREWVSAIDEWRFIEKYIALEELRQGKGLQVQVEVDEKGIAEVHIPPMICLVFVENALKHSHQAGFENYNVLIQAKVKEQGFYFSCKNPYGTYTQTHVNSGIGLKNTEERIRLIYGDDAQLRIQKNEHSFQVEMILPMHHHAKK